MEKEYIYDRNNVPFDITNFTYYNEGMCARIFKENDLMLKIYKSDTSFRYVLSRRMFSMLQELDLPNIVKLYNYYYMEYKKHHLSPIKAYSMEYVKGDKGILNENKNYILSAMYALENTCLTLAEHKIEINDSHTSNIIFNNLGATLIDVDTYTYNRLKSVNKIFAHNKEEVLYALKSRIKRELLDQELEIDYYKMLYLLNIDVMHKSITEELDKRLKEIPLIENIRKL